MNNLENACFIKIGCYTCRRNEENRFIMFGDKYRKCKDYHLTLEEKKRKLLSQ